MTRSVAVVSLALVVSTIGARQPSERFLVQLPFAQRVLAQSASGVVGRVRWARATARRQPVERGARGLGRSGRLLQGRDRGSPSAVRDGANSQGHDLGYERTAG
jgi:hypothetical protein